MVVFGLVKVKYSVVMLLIFCFVIVVGSIYCFGGFGVDEVKVLFFKYDVMEGWSFFLKYLIFFCLLIVCFEIFMLSIFGDKCDFEVCYYRGVVNIGFGFF